MTLFFKKWILASGVFGVSLAMAYKLWDFISLPFENPFQVVGDCTRIRFNPENDVLRFCLFLGLPSLCLVLACVWKQHWFLDRSFLKQPRRDMDQDVEKHSSRQSFLLLILAVSYAVLIAINVPTYHAFGRFDAYHEGESLGAAMSALQGGKPYQDFLFFHGLIQDPLRSVWAFHGLGRSIASERCWESAAKILTWIFLALLMVELFSKKYRWIFGGLSLGAIGYVSFSFNTFGSLWVPVMTPSHLIQAFLLHQNFWKEFNFLIIPSRDFLTFLFGWIFLKLVEWTHGEKRVTWRFRILSALIGFIPVAALGYSVDRGVYLTAVAFLGSIVFLSILPKDLKKEFGVFAIGGLFAAIVWLNLLFQGAWKAFFQFTFVEMPAFKELSEKFPYPIHQVPFLLACILLAGHLYRLVWIALHYALRSEKREGLKFFFVHHLVELLFLILSIFYFRNVLARPDLEHLIYSLAPLYLLTFYVLQQKIKKGMGEKLRWRVAFQTIVSILTITLMVLSVVRDIRSDVIRENFPLGEPDSAFILPEQQALIERLKPLIRKGDGFFTMTSQAAWYYLLDQPCPTRYPYLWIAAPQRAQEEIVRDLAQKKVKWVLYQDADWSYRIDGISNQDKFPVINQYILRNYRPYFSIDGHQVWILKRG